MPNHTTTAPPALNTTVRGPWNSKYTVSIQTLAVNLGQTARILDEDENLDLIAAIDAAVDAFEVKDVINDGSIRGFWAWVWSGLSLGSQRQVAKRAEMLLEADRSGSHGSRTDLFEQFDGQR